MRIIEIDSKEFTPEIVLLLKKTLGETKLLKSEQFWNWKHHENPFGNSYTLAAFSETNELVGLRAFLKWQFQNNELIIDAARAVDTAVHPAFQGKKLFTKLTLQAIDILKKNKTKIIYNTPNKISKPGYLKMGWEENGKMPLLIKINKHFPNKYSTLFCEQIEKNYPLPNNFQQLGNISCNQHQNAVFKTKTDYEYLNWRYIKCPIIQYSCIYTLNSFLIIFRLKQVKGFIELRICEILVFEHCQSTYNNIYEAIEKLEKKIKPLYTSIAGFENYFIQKKKIVSSIFLHNLKIGPIVTIKKVDCENTYHSFRRFTNWHPSIGCLELF